MILEKEILKESFDIPNSTLANDFEKYHHYIIS
jgi:hypothetical protein